MSEQRSDPIRVMLVDDHSLVRSAIRNALKAPDVQVIAEAATGEEALLLAPQVHPDVLLVDIDLPGMDGVALVRELAPRLPSTRIVVLTVSKSEEHLVEATRYGAAGYLVKDVSPEALLRAVRSAHGGELAMSRAMASRLVHHLVEDSRHPRTRGGPGLDALTLREQEILRLLADGLTDREIAESLTISPRTVATHVSSILHKLGARSRGDAARRYLAERQ